MARWTKALIVVALVAILAGGIGFLYRRHQQWKWGPIPMPERIARVTADWPADTLAKRLQASGKVRDAATFREAARIARLTTVAAGGYTLPEAAGPLDLARIFKQPPALLKVTFPEGWTAGRIADRLKLAGFTSADDFRQLAYPAGQPVSPLEGKLFPDTYYLPRSGNAQELATRLQERYVEVTTALPKPFPGGPNGSPLSLAEITTLASLVERETDVPEERALIAGVLLSRLHRNMRLQCDASVQYAMERAAATGALAAGHKERLLYRDLKIDSPYNTYLHRSLPPGPICNPGAASLQAAARPQSTEFLYYVWSPRFHKHRFGKTFAEHEHNIGLARQERS